MGKKLAIKIDSSDIMIVEGKYTNNTFFASNHCTIKTPEGAISSGEIIDELAIRTIIAEELKKRQIKTKSVTILIDSTQTISRVIKLPFVTKNSDVISMIKYELDQILPIDVSAYSFVYSVLNRYIEDEVDKAEYYVNGIPTLIIDKYKDLMKSLGLSIESVNFSYINLESVPKNSKEYKNEKHNEEVIGFIDFGYDNTVLSTLNQGEHDFSRIIDNGCQRIINETKGFFDKTDQEIQFMIKNMYMKEDESVKESNLVSMLRSRFEDLATEINRYIKYYKTNSKGVPFGRLYIYGSGLYPKDMLEYLEELTGINTELIDKLSYLNTSKTENFDIGRYFDLVMALTVSKNRVNLLTMEVAESKRRTNKILISLAIIIPVVSLLSLFVWNRVEHVNEVKTDIEDMRNEMAKPENVELMKKIENLKNERAAKELAIANFNIADMYMLSNDIVYSKYFDDISLSTPLDTYVSQITFNFIENQGIVVYLQCTSDSFTSIAQYEKNLLNLGYYKSVETTSISHDDKYIYVLMCRVKGGNIDEN